jgi:hypothetical protein
MEQYFFSNRTEQFLYDTLSKNIGKRTGQNISNYPEVRSILQNSIRRVYSSKDTFPEIRSPNMLMKNKITFLQKKILRNCLPTIIGHIKTVDQAQQNHRMNPIQSHKNQPVDQPMSSRQFDNTVMPADMRKSNIPIQRPQVGNLHAFQKSNTTQFQQPQQLPQKFTQPHQMTQPQQLIQPQQLPQQMMQPQQLPRQMTQQMMQTQPQQLPRQMMQPQQMTQPQQLPQQMMQPQQLPQQMMQPPQLPQQMTQPQQLPSQQYQSHDLNNLPNYTNINESVQNLLTQSIEQAVKQDIPIKDLAERSDQLLKERESELSSLFQQQPRVPEAQLQHKISQQSTQDLSIETQPQSERQPQPQQPQLQSEPQPQPQSDLQPFQDPNSTTQPIIHKPVQHIQETSSTDNTMRLIEELNQFRQDMDLLRRDNNELRLEITDIKELNESQKSQTLDNSDTQNIQKIYDEQFSEIHDTYKTMKTQLEDELKLLKEQLDKQQKIILSQHQFLQTNDKLMNHIVLSVDSNNRIKPVKWNEITDDVGVVVGKKLYVKSHLMDLNHYSIILPNTSFTSVTSLKKLKILKFSCKTFAMNINTPPEFISIKVILHKTTDDCNELVSYTSFLKLCNSDNNDIVYEFSSEDMAYNRPLELNNDKPIIANIQISPISSVSPVSPVSLDSSPSSNGQLTSLLKNTHMCYDILGFDLMKKIDGTLLFGLKINKEHLKYATNTLKISHISFYKSIKCDSPYFSKENIQSFEKWLESNEHKIVMNLQKNVGDIMTEVLYINVPLTKFNFIDRPSHPGDNWILNDQFNILRVKVYGLTYFNDIDNQIYLECSY